MKEYPINKCECGSGYEQYPLLDGYGIFLCYACLQCEEEKLLKYRPDIMEHYECDETLEPEDY